MVRLACRGEELTAMPHSARCCPAVLCFLFALCSCSRTDNKEAARLRAEAEAARREVDLLVGTWRSGKDAEVQVEVTFAKTNAGRFSVEKFSVEQQWKKPLSSFGSTGVYELKESDGVRYLELSNEVGDTKVPQ